MSRLRRAKEQLSHLVHETRKMNGDRWWRWGGVWFTDSFWAVASYRLSRSAFMAFGNGWPAARVVLSPALFALRPWFAVCDINYRADIGPGLRVLHPNLGVVISGSTVAGKNLILVGGNCIGGRKPGEIRIGNNVLMGANSSVMGPISVGDNAKIGAQALVTHDVPAGEVMLAPHAVSRRGD